MICVFGSFVLSDLRVLKLIGFGLAFAVFIDATVVRLVLVPATMELLGDRNWWFPSWLEWLPRIHVEGGETRTPPRTPEPPPQPVAATDRLDADPSHGRRQPRSGNPTSHDDWPADGASRSGRPGPATQCARRPGRNAAVGAPDGGADGTTQRRTSASASEDSAPKVRRPNVQERRVPQVLHVLKNRSLPSAEDGLARGRSPGCA